nr:ATP-binding protein [uncultured Acetatifactor sp.]
MENQNDRDIYVIPPNFVDTGTFFGGMFKARNVIEAGILAGGTGIPVFLFLPAGLTVRVIVLCLTSLPLGLFALIGISGESLTSFLAIFLKYLRNRRVVGGDKEEVQGQKGKARRTKPQGAGSQDGDCHINGRESRRGDRRGSLQRSRKETGLAVDYREMCGEAHPERRQVIARGHTSGRNNSKDSTDRKNYNVRKNSKGSIGGISGWRRTGEEDFPEEFDQVKGYEIRQKLRPSQGRRSHEEWDGEPGSIRNGGTESMGDKRQDSRRRQIGDVQKRAGQGNSDRQGKPSGQVNTGRQGKPNGQVNADRHGKANIQVNAERYGKTIRQAEGDRQGKSGRQAKAEMCHIEGRNRYNKDAGMQKKLNANSQGQDRAKHRSSAKAKHQPQAFLNPLAEYLPISKVENGMIYTKDHRYVKVVEVVPINFLLRSAREQRGIIYSFVSYLKISPVKLQFKVLTRRADIGRHINTVRREMAQETNGQCRLMQEDYLQFVQQISSREAVTRRFFLIFEYEPWDARRGDEEAEAISQLQGAVRTASNYLRQCGNEVVIPDNEDEFTVEVLYNLLCRNESAEKPLARKVQEVEAGYRNSAGGSWSRQDMGDTEDGSCHEDSIPAVEFFAPKSIDFTHSHYICIDGLYYAYLMVPSDGYRSQVPAGWLSLMVNAGDGIDLDMFLSRQPKELIIQKVGQQLRINRSRIKDASDTNTDFDDIDSAIRSGYFLKEGLANNEDFYYMNLLVTVTASTVDDLEWKVNEMKKLLLSQDMRASACHFREEQAFLSTLPLVSVEKKLYGRSRRNLLTGGAAGCYPFTSYEMCDDNGILLGVNKYNSSLIIVDIFNSAVYKNANMAILGTSGAGKTFTMQLMALRMRRKGIPIFIIAPLKGHEFHRACANVGGEFIQVSPASPHCINVMEIRQVDRSVSALLDGPDITLSELAEKIQRLHIFFSLLIPDMTHEERQLLDEAMIHTYNAKGITHDNGSLADPDCPERYREMPVLGDLYRVLKESPDTQRLANILNRLVNGSASTFNQQTNVSLQNKYTVLDISSLTGDLLTVGMFVALDFVWDRAKEDRTEEKTIFIDECWQLLSGAGATGTRLAGDFVLEIFKTIRGYGGSAVCASQDLNDFFNLDGGRFGKGIINNSKTKIILNLEDEEAVRVQDALHLSDAEVMEITHFERGNGLISTNSNNIMIEFKASPLEKELITTDRRELKELVERMRQGDGAELE